MSEPPFNPIFTRLVPLNADHGESLTGLVAYSLYKVAKREWAREITTRTNARPTDTQLADYAATWTESRLVGLEQQAETALGEFANTVVNDATPKIREDALKGSSIKNVLLSMLAAFLYTILLIGLLVVARVAGVDVVSIAQFLGGSQPQAAANSSPQTGKSLPLPLGKDPPLLGK